MKDPTAEYVARVRSRMAEPLRLRARHLGRAAVATGQCHSRLGSYLAAVSERIADDANIELISGHRPYWAAKKQASRELWCWSMAVYEFGAAGGTLCAAFRIPLATVRVFNKWKRCTL